MKITCNENGIVKWKEDVDEVMKYQQMTDIDSCKVKWNDPDRFGLFLNGKRIFPLVKPKKHYEIQDVSWREENDQGYIDIILKDITPIEKIDLNMNLIKNVNLLPKECQMKTRYVVVNLKEKEEFEKKWEMRYGYNNSPYIGFDQKEAINWINQNLGPNERKDYVVERHNAGKIDVVWKIMEGHKLAGQEEDWDELEDL